MQTDFNEGQSGQDNDQLKTAIARIKDLEGQLQDLQGQNADLQKQLQQVDDLDFAGIYSEHQEELAKRDEWLSKYQLGQALKVAGADLTANDIEDPLESLWSRYKGQLTLDNGRLTSFKNGKNGRQMGVDEFVDTVIRTNQYDRAYFEEAEDSSESKPVVYSVNGQINLRGTGFSLSDVREGRVEVRTK